MIFHVVPLDDWLVAPDRPYAPASLPEDGFVHCSPDVESKEHPDAIILAVANTFYADTSGPLMVLLIDEEALDTPVRWEPADPPLEGIPPGILFPHVYGRINRTAVAGMMELERGEDGRWASLSLWS